VNAFNVIRIAQLDVGIDCMVWRPGEEQFVAASTEQFRRTEVVASGACTGIVNSQAVAEAASETIARSNERSND
jgi:hypothetical protein